LEAFIRETGRPNLRAGLALLQPLSRLYGGRPLAAEAENPLQAAVQLTESFTRHHHHAAPFSRRALAEIWRRCEGDEQRRERCVKARARVEGRLGDLESALATDG
jgi:hypothetical protein